MLWVYRWVFNPLLVWLLRSRLHRLASGRVMLITYMGRRTGRRITIPVSYRTSDSQLRVTVGQYHQKQWWRNLTTESPVKLQLRRRRVQAMATAVEKAARRSQRTDRSPPRPRCTFVSVDSGQG